MTATTYAPAPTAATLGGTARPPLLRLAVVELRKMADTRAGFWLLVVTALAAVALIVVTLFVGDAPDLTFANLFQSTLLPTAVLMPVLGILAATSEWNQRTALTTFVLTPQRQRVAAAKLLAAVLLAVLSVVAGLVFAAVGNIVGAAVAGGDGSWSFSASALGSAVLFQVINVVMGVAFGMLLMNSALAIVIYFLLPTVWGVLGATISALEKPAQWLDLGVTSPPLADNTMTGEGWAKLAVSVGVWVLVPLAAGLIRLQRREVA